MLGIKESADWKLGQVYRYLQEGRIREGKVIGVVGSNGCRHSVLAQLIEEGGCGYWFHLQGGLVLMDEGEDNAHGEETDAGNMEE